MIAEAFLSLPLFLGGTGSAGSSSRCGLFMANWGRLEMNLVPNIMGVPQVTHGEGLWLFWERLAQRNNHLWLFPWAKYA